MKKTFSLIILTILMLSMLTLTGCSTDGAVVESVMEIDSAFCGHRSITVKFPLSVHIDDFAQQLIDDNPLKNFDKSKFEYIGVEQDGYTFLMDLVFDSHEDYISQVETLIGREVFSQMSQPNSVLCSGTRMKEDFDVSELVAWITQASAQNDDTNNIGFDYAVNTVSIDGSVFNTASTIDISEREGMAVNSILVETTNLKDGTYDRTITFSVPNKTYVDLSGSIDRYFTANTSPSAQYCDWTSQGSSWEYKVIYKGLSLEELSEFTAMLLDTDNVSLYYGDKDNSSTPLSEGLVFEESFNTFSFISPNGDDVKLSYKYALPTKTTHGDGALMNEGKWSVTGSWQEGIYSVDIDSDTVSIRIPDGIQYAINGIRMNLEVLDKDSFVRSTELLYSKTQGMDGMLYAESFFNSKGVNVELSEDEENLICKVISEGDHDSITQELVKCFGSGNFMAYTVKQPTLSLCAKTQLTEYIDFSYMLNSNNANRPITYTVRSLGDENIVDLDCDSSESVKSNGGDEKLTVEVKNGQGTVSYNGNIPNVKNIVIYCLVGAVMLLLSLTIIVLMLRKEKAKATDEEKSFAQDTDPALQQTTTFSITELKLRKEKIDKHYRDEIDKDIEEKIEADRIETLTKETKLKELEKLTRMVNGEPLDDGEPKTIATEDEDDV